MSGGKFLQWLRQRTRLERATLLLWTFALLVCCIPTIVNPGTHNVYPVYEAAGSNWRHAVTLYPTPEKDKELLFRYSPLVAASFAPWSLLPERLGAVLWRLLNAWIFLHGLFWYGRTVLADALPATRRPLLFLFSLLLVGVNIFNGQANALVLGLMLMAVAAVVSSRFTLAAALMAAACLFKGYPMALGLLLMAFYPRRFAPRLLFFLALGLALPFLLQDPRYALGEYRHWVQHLHNDNDRQSFGYFGCFRDLRLLSSCVGMEMSYTTYQIVELLLGAGIAIYCLAAWFRGVTERVLLHLMLALGCCWMTVFGPATELCTYGLVAPAMALLLVECLERKWSLVFQTLCWATFGMLCLPVVAGWFDLQRSVIMPPLQPLATLILFLWLLGTGVWYRRAGNRNEMHRQPCIGRKSQ